LRSDYKYVKSLAYNFNVKSCTYTHKDETKKVKKKHKGFPLCNCKTLFINRTIFMTVHLNRQQMLTNLANINLKP